MATTDPPLADLSQTNAPMGGLAIERESTSEQVAGVVRKAILRGDLPPGTQLREAALATSIGISRNTVREAIKVLAREGLVTHHMHRGAEVARLSEADVADIFKVRRVLELRAIDATADAGAQRLEDLRRTLENMTEAVDSRDFERIIESDVSFHRSLVAFLDSPRTDRFFGAIQAELRLCVSIVDRQAEDPKPLIAEHLELFDLIASGRQLECQSRMREHLEDAERLLRAIARNSEGATPTDASPSNEGDA